MPAERFNASSIRNKMKREDVHRSMKKKKGQDKLKRRLALAEAERKDPAARKQRVLENQPKTLDNMREYDPSLLTAKPIITTDHAADGTNASTSTPQPNATNGMDEENAYDIAVDPFAAYFTSAPVNDDEDDETEPAPPKILITTSSKATKVSFDFCEELVGVVPGGEFIRRKKNKGFEIGRIAGWAAGRGYSSLMVVNEDRKRPNAITMIHLPHGPTAYFKLTSIELTKEIYGHARASPHYPELVLNGFVTRLGHLVGRMFQTIFPPLPEFEGRQVVTLHNQRDFLFFRRHRYMFKTKDKAVLQEIGPRFTLKLRYIKKGTPAVLQYGAAPPPLVFDVASDDDDQGEKKAQALIGASHEPSDVTSRRGDLDEGSDSDTQNTPKGVPSLEFTAPPVKDEEFIWQFKSDLEVSRKTFFL